VRKGSPKAVRQNSKPPGQPEPPDRIGVEVPTGRCYGRTNDGEVSCRKGSLAFSVSSTINPVEAKDGEYTSRYRVKGKTTTFPSPKGLSARGGADLHARAEEFRRDVLDAQLAKIILAKI